MRGRKKRTLILGILYCLLIFMGVGFAVARTTLNIGGTSTAINTWDVRIANIAVSSKSDDVTIDLENTTIGNDGVSANLKADFVKPGDYITYEILVENNGSIDATLNDLAIDTMPSTEADKNLYIIESTMPENAKLEAGKSLTFTITITFNKDAEKLPEGDVNFGVSLDYSQGNTPEGGGNTPGGGNVPETDWDFIVNDSGEIIAYNYDLGTDVVIPATNYEGKEIKSVTSKSFQNKNIEYYQDPSTGQVHSVIYEDEPNFSVVKEKAIILFAIETCGSTACVPQIEAALSLYKTGEYTFPYGITASFYIDPDPSVDINNSVGSIKRNVTTLDLNEATNLITIEDNAFNNSGLESVDFGENSNVTSIGNYAFLSNSLISVEIPDNVETIGISAFSNNQIETLTLGTAIEAQNQLTKNNKYSLTKLTAGVQKTSASNSKLKSIGSNAFYNNKIQSLALPSSVTKLGNFAFDSNPLKTLTVEKCSKDVCTNGVFGSNLIDVTVNAGEIDTFAFSISPLERVKIGSDVTKIADLAVLNFNLLVTGDSTVIILDESNFNIIKNTFTNVVGSEITFKKASQVNLDESILDSSLLYFNIVTRELEEATSKVKELNLSSSTSLKEIGYRAFYKSQITSLSIPDSVTTIGDSAFDLNQISSLTLGEDLTTIGDSAFSGNQISGELIIPDSVTTIGDSAFSQNQISSLTLGEDLTTIGDSAFYGNQISGELIIPDSVTAIGFSAFMLNQISSLVLGNSLTEIGGQAFIDNQISGQLIIPNSVTTIGINAFNGNQISNLMLGKNLVSLDRSSFSNNKIDSLTIEQCNTTICGGTNYFTSPIKTLIIKSGEIGEGAFHSKQISSLTLGEGVTMIGNSAFSYNQISSLIIPSSVTKIDSFAFEKQNSKLLSILIKRTEQDFLENVIVGTDWYDNSLNPTITYDPS